MDGLIVDADRMLQNLDGSYGLVFSQRVLLALTEAGMARDEAFRRVQTHALAAWDEQSDFRELLEADDAITSVLDQSALDGLFDPSAFLIHIDASFRRVTPHETVSQVRALLAERGVSAEPANPERGVQPDLFVQRDGVSVALQFHSGSHPDERAIQQADAIIRRDPAIIVFAVSCETPPGGSWPDSDTLRWTTRMSSSGPAAAWSRGTAAQLADALLRAVAGGE